MCSASHACHLHSAAHSAPNQTVNQQSCEAKGCCWAPTTNGGDNGVPWCFNAASTASSCFSLLAEPLASSPWTATEVTLWALVWRSATHVASHAWLSRLRSPGGKHGDPPEEESQRRWHWRLHGLSGKAHRRTMLDLPTPAYLRTCAHFAMCAPHTALCIAGSSPCAQQLLSRRLQGTQESGFAQRQRERRTMPRSLRALPTPRGLTLRAPCYSTTGCVTGP